MPRSRIALLAALLAWPLTGSAQQVSAITDYLKPIVSKIASDPNAGGWTWETNRNGGYLLRKAMDVTGDGRPELFVATTLQATRHEQTWTVFEVAEDGTLRPYCTTLEESSAWPIVEGDKTHLVYVLPPDKERMRDSDERFYPVHRFAFTFPEIKKSLSYVSEAEVAKLRPPASEQLPKLQAILLADYLTEPDAKWVDVTEWKLDANDCFFRPEDTERAMKNTDFTPQAALAILDLPQQAPRNRNSATPQTSTPAFLPTVAQPIPTKAHESKPTHPATSGKPITLTPWGVILILIVAVISLAWVLLKNRK
jgi:hypothetical protein